jgi:hypothetical protein
VRRTTLTIKVWIFLQVFSQNHAGYLLLDQWRDYRIIEDRLYSRVAGFVTVCEVDNMDFTRLNNEAIERKARQLVVER